MPDKIDKKKEVKKFLLTKLKEEGAYWSYNKNSFTWEKFSDRQLIADTMRYLDLREIDLLFNIFSKKKIKKAWKELLVPEGDYLYSLNRFFAWYYFDAKKPDSYLKNIETRNLNKILNEGSGIKY